METGIVKTGVLCLSLSLFGAGSAGADAVIYIGIHFRHAVERGVLHGRRIAHYAVSKFLRPVR